MGPHTDPNPLRGRMAAAKCKPSNLLYKLHQKSQNLNVSRLLLSLPNPLKPGVKSIMEMQLEQRRQAMLQLHLSDQKF